MIAISRVCFDDTLLHNTGIFEKISRIEIEFIYNVPDLTRIVVRLKLTTLFC